MRAEIDAAKADLQAQDGSDRYLSFPFGMRSDYGDEACAYALQRGYRAAFEVRDGWNPLHRQARRVIGRVSLGAQQNTPADLYAALELQPLLKGVLHRADQTLGYPRPRCTSRLSQVVLSAEARV